jgi:glycosyltransferase involved in cell wall biosynthesis
MAAMAQVVRAVPEARLLVVGEGPPELAPQELARRAGLPADRLEAVGYADAQTFESLMRSVDVGVSLRHPTLGETSGAVVRLIAHGVPVVVSAGGWYDELPAAAVARVPADALEVPLLARVLERLLTDPALRARMGDAGRRYAAERLSPEAVADEWLRFVLAPAGARTLADGLVAGVAARLDEVTTPEARRLVGVAASVARAMRGIGIA